MERGRTSLDSVSDGGTWMGEIKGSVNGKTITKLPRTSTSTRPPRDVEGVRRPGEIVGTLDMALIMRRRLWRGLG